MRLSSLAFHYTLLSSFFTFTAATAAHKWPRTHHTNKFGYSSRRVQSFAGRTAHRVARNAPDAPGNEWGKPHYSLTDKWCGSNFFDGWTFYTHSDPTHGRVNYVNSTTAFADELAYVAEDGHAVMKVDATTDLPLGTKRNSVRISTNKAYNKGLFVLDAAKFPYGCAVWPAWWMVGPSWPNSGEIDIFEGVNLNSVNQYTAHTAAGCNISTSPSPDFTVPPSSATLGVTSCGPTKNNGGCYYVDDRDGSYGADLNVRGGAVLVMQWEVEGLRIWNFPRGYVPLDLEFGAPRPENWSSDFLKGAWESTTCPSSTYFRNMSMVFDITLCGDWAGTVYPTSGCPGNCTAQVMTGSNFADAAWAINYVAVYSRDNSEH